MADLQQVNMPVMVLGDLNADPLRRNGTDSYPVFAAAGFNDTWAVLHPQDAAGGLTFGHDPGLADPGTEFVSRIDYVLYRGNQFIPTAIDILDPTIGKLPPLWPSDHAAITATFMLRNSRN